MTIAPVHGESELMKATLAYQSQPQAWARSVLPSHKPTQPKIFLMDIE